MNLSKRKLEEPTREALANTRRKLVEIWERRLLEAGPCATAAAVAILLQLSGTHTAGDAERLSLALEAWLKLNRLHKEEQ